MKFKKFIFIAMLALTVGIGGGFVNAAVTPFSQDINDAIDDGIDYFRNTTGIFTGNAGWATGLVTLALLEKRAGADFDDPQLGYANSAAADQARARDAADYMITLVNSNNFYSYGYGASMMALSFYQKTGGPEVNVAPYNAPLTIRQAIDKMSQT